MRFRDKELLFWVEVFGVQGSAMPLTMLRVLVFGAYALVVTALHLNKHLDYSLHIGVGPHEVAGAALGLLLVLRTNAGYERWWEGRKLWGGIVNQSRNLAIDGLAYGPADRAWRDQFIRWSAAFPHAVRLNLRDQRHSTSLVGLLGREAADRVFASHHMPNAIALHLAGLLRQAHEKLGMSAFAFHQAEGQRATLIDHLGACERIRSSPLPLAYRIEIRRFILFFLITLPFALLEEAVWLTPVVTMFVAAPILALDKIGTELQFPFSQTSLNHLPLDQLCHKIETDLLAMLDRGDTLMEAPLQARARDQEADETPSLSRSTAS
ncbi:bestrophin family protein [Planctomyces sp. SH-PL62]|uniref:bestrophin family protein n=1 Tax=Planctomyces sp. SH-PL62 TaxID=1636152 RepID=UPI00078BF5F7|nr:bestrophin family ion channel [Planctomyces sp. SH-PL62]AMV36279.1 Bestrophin, RFP-TM, chloride channel [Planctomyces sp. SH-PL62]